MLHFCNTLVREEERYHTGIGIEQVVLLMSPGKADK